MWPKMWSLLLDIIDHLTLYDLMFFSFIFKNFLTLLKYSRFKLFISSVQQIELYIYIYIYVYIHMIYPFFIFFSIMIYHRIFNIVPCATINLYYSIYSSLCSVLFVYPIYNGLYLLIPNSQSFPNVFSVSVSLFLFHRYVHLYHILDSTCEWYMWCLSLSNLLWLVW